MESDFTTTANMTSPSTDGSLGESSVISHKVSKLDSLAGLAIRYGVSVSDIKRQNGLLSDSAMFARDTIMIPTRGQPVGEEVAMMFAQIVSGIGRDACLNADTHLNPGSAAVARIARTLNLAANVGGEFEDERLMMRRNSGSSYGEVELIERSQGSSGLFIPSSGAGPTRLAEHVRRRRAGGDGEDDDQEGTSPSHSGGSDDAQSKQRRARGGQWNSFARSGPTDGAQRAHMVDVAALKQFFSWKQIANAVNSSQLVQKIAAAAQQPALGGTGGGFSAVADAMLTGSGSNGRVLCTVPPSRRASTAELQRANIAAAAACKPGKAD